MSGNDGHLPYEVMDNLLSNVIHVYVPWCMCHVPNDTN